MDDPKIANYRKALLHVSNQLEEKDVKSLKFLCQDQMTVPEGESIKDGLDIFKILEKKGLISSGNVEFLVDKLGDIHLLTLKQELQEMIKGCDQNDPKSNAGPENSGQRMDNLGGTYTNCPLFFGSAINNKIVYHGSETSQPPIPPSGATNLANVSGPKPSTEDKVFKTPADLITSNKSSFGPTAPHTIFGPAPSGIPSSSSKSQKLDPNPQKSQPLFKGEPLNAGESRISTSPQLAQQEDSGNHDMNGTSNLDDSPQTSELLAKFLSNTPQSSFEATASHTHPDISSPSTLSSPSSSSKSWTSKLNPQKSQSLFKGEPPNSGQSHISTSTQSTPPQNPSNSDRYSPDDPMEVETSPLKAKRSAPVDFILAEVDVKIQKMGEGMSGLENLSKKPVGVEKEGNSGNHPWGSLVNDVKTYAPSLPRMKDDDALSKNAAGVLSQDVSALNVEVDSEKQVRNGACGQSLDLGAASGDYSRNLEEGQTGRAKEKKADHVTLRDYQEELTYHPLTTGDNYIICAPTGSGKTLTAAGICHMKYQRNLADPTQKKHFKALFIVNIRHLTQQQKYAFQKYFQDILAVSTLGEQQSFEAALIADAPMPVVLMLTAQIFVNALRQKVVKLQDLDMLIFDECHHTDFEHPYNVIMKMYLKQKSSSQGVGEHVARLPQVIGLSASLGFGRGQNSGLMHVMKLCANMDVRDVIRVHRHKEQLASFVKVPEQDVMIPVPARAASSMAFRNLLRKIMNDIQKELGESGRNLPFPGCQPYENEVVSRQESSSNHEDIIAYKYLHAYNRAMMLYEDLAVKDCLKILEIFHANRSCNQDEEETSKEQLFKNMYDTNLTEMERITGMEDEDSNPKLKNLISLLAEQFSQNPCSKGIILTRMKIATVSLCEFIRASHHLKQLTCPVLPERLVGKGAVEEYAMTESEQRMILDSFRQVDGCNVLVATDIAQEGLDMPACNFVIRYNFVSNEIGTVQSKGRARAEGSKCFLIVESGSANELRELANREKVRLMEEAMKRFEELTEGQRLERIKKKQDEIIQAILESEHQKQQWASSINLEETVIECAECKTFICIAIDLRRKGSGGHVTCIDPTFQDRVIEQRSEETERYRDTERIGTILCGNYPACKNTLGTKELFHLRSTSEGFGLKAKSFRVKSANGGKKKLKKWKELPIEEDEDL